jgi:hypothetical protein
VAVIVTVLERTLPLSTGGLNDTVTPLAANESDSVSGAL